MFGPNGAPLPLKRSSQLTAGLDSALWHGETMDNALPVGSPPLPFDEDMAVLPRVLRCTQRSTRKAVTKKLQPTQAIRMSRNRQFQSEKSRPRQAHPCFRGEGHNPLTNHYLQHVVKKKKDFALTFLITYA